MALCGLEYSYITSDCDAVATVFEYQNYTKSPEDAVADVLKAGPHNSLISIKSVESFMQLL